MHKTLSTLVVSGALLGAGTGLLRAAELRSSSPVDRPVQAPTASCDETPFWSARLMKNEPILFIQEEGSPSATGKLLFIPTSQPLLTHPDLVMIAYGMNHGEAGPQFEADMRALLTAVQQAAPQTDVILVSPMTQAPAQGKIAPKFFAYRDALLNLTSPQVALADVTTPFTQLLNRKEFSDLSGNNYNHPNDFTHRLYAQLICQLFPAGN